MGRPSSYPAAFRRWAVSLVGETRAGHASEFDAIRSVATKLGSGSPETLRMWVRRSEIDSGQRPG